MRKSIERHIEDDADQIELRLRELESEWNIERLLETNAAALSLAGLVLGATVNRKFYWGRYPLKIERLRQDFDLRKTQNTVIKALIYTINPMETGLSKVKLRQTLKSGLMPAPLAVLRM